MESEAQPESVKDAPDSQLRSGILSADSPH